MTLLKQPDANPAFLFALGQSLHWLEAHGHEVQDVEDLQQHIFLSDTGEARLKTCLHQAIQAGMVTQAVEDEARQPEVEGIGLTESWHSTFGPDATMKDLSVCINRHLQPDNKGLADLHAVGEALLAMDVLGGARLLPDVVEAWNEGWKERGLDELNLRRTQLDDLCRWAYFLGWVRRFGAGTIIPDFSPWLLSWLDRHPRHSEERASDLWSDMVLGLPLLAGYGPEDAEAAPEPISIALLALEERGRCRFVDPSDSPDNLLTLRVNGKAQKVVKARRVEWVAGGAQ